MIRADKLTFFFSLKWSWMESCWGGMLPPRPPCFAAQPEKSKSGDAHQRPKITITKKPVLAILIIVVYCQEVKTKQNWQIISLTFFICISLCFHSLSLVGWSRKSQRPHVGLQNQRIKSKCKMWNSFNHHVLALKMCVYTTLIRIACTHRKWVHKKEKYFEQSQGHSSLFLPIHHFLETLHFWTLHY